MCQFREGLALLGSFSYLSEMTNAIKESGGYSTTVSLAVSQVIKMGGQLPSLMSKGFRYRLREVRWNESLAPWSSTLFISPSSHFSGSRCSFRQGCRPFHPRPTTSIIRRSETHKNETACAATSQQDSSHLVYSTAGCVCTTTPRKCDVANTDNLKCT